jgi:hypothetical protein
MKAHLDLSSQCRRRVGASTSDGWFTNRERATKWLPALPMVTWLHREAIAGTALARASSGPSRVVVLDRQNG